MRGLERVPSEEELLEAYGELQRWSPPFGSAPASRADVLERVALYARWARLDPRLGELLVRYLAVGWRMLSPLDLRERNLAEVWPAVLGVLLEMTEFVCEPSEKALFSRWKDLVMEGVPRAPNEQFFVGLSRLGGKLMLRAVTESLPFYRKWGYFGRDLLVNKANVIAQDRGQTRLTKAQRAALLDELVARCAATGRSFTVRDYREALGFWVSARQAERDLAAHPKLRARGATRGRRYGR
jgi:hypothetical protein